METLTNQDLEQFTCTEHYYKHWISKTVYTDGVKHVADKAGAYWLIDAILSYNKTESFQLWKLVKTGTKAVLTMQEDIDTRVLVKQEIGYTDFPLDEIKFYLQNGVLLLPSEY